MKRFVEGVARDQGGLFPMHLEDFVGEDNPVRVVDAFVEMLDLRELGFASVDPSSTGRPSYHPGVLLKLYIYGYLNRISSSRRLERGGSVRLNRYWSLYKWMSAFWVMPQPGLAVAGRSKPDRVSSGQAMSVGVWYCRR